MDTDGFLNALTRMTARRGVPQELTSDNGSNLVGANNELKQLLADLDQEKIQDFASGKGYGVALPAPTCTPL